MPRGNGGDGDPYICMLAGHGISKPERFYPFCKSTPPPLLDPFLVFSFTAGYLQVARFEDPEPAENVSYDALESNFESIVILDRYVLNCSNINDLKAIIKNNSRRERIGGRSSRKKRGDDL